jgi:hypothetical protein
MGRAMYAVDFLNERTWLVVRLGDGTIFYKVLTLWTSGNRGERRSSDSAAIGATLSGDSHHRNSTMVTNFVGLDVSQKMTAICVVDNAGRKVWRGQCPTAPEQIAAMVRRQVLSQIFTVAEKGLGR